MGRQKTPSHSCRTSRQKTPSCRLGQCRQKTPSLPFTALPAGPSSLFGRNGSPLPCCGRSVPSGSAAVSRCGCFSPSRRAGPRPRPGGCCRAAGPPPYRPFGPVPPFPLAVAGAGVGSRCYFLHPPNTFFTKASRHRSLEIAKKVFKEKGALQNDTEVRSLLGGLRPYCTYRGLFTIETLSHPTTLNANKLPSPLKILSQRQQN